MYETLFLGRLLAEQCGSSQKVTSAIMRGDEVGTQMNNIIPVPVRISVGVPAGPDPRGEVRNLGSFRIVPYATTRGGTLDIDGWRLLEEDGETCALDDRMLFGVMPRKLLCIVCQQTFETDRPSMPVVLTIDDETWRYEMRARELEYEQVHYEIEIAGQWMRMIDTYVGDLLDDEHFAFAAREVTPNIDFGHAETVYNDMN